MIKKILKNMLNIPDEDNGVAINKFRSKSDNLITFEELKSIKINEVIQINKTFPGLIEVIRINSNNNNLMFTVTMKANQLWEKHHHDCEEICVVYKGKLTDVVSRKSAGPAELLQFKAYQSHYVIAEKDTVFYVEFKNPIKK